MYLKFLLLIREKKKKEKVLKIQNYNLMLSNEARFFL